MKKISLLLALMAFFFTDLALAASAVVTSLTGNVQVQTGAAAPRLLRQGDEVVQGDTVTTAAASSVVLRFDDGQVAALTASSRMQITAYTFNPQAKTGNILLSLVVGGMRAITGLIGHNQPDSVKFRAATATIGIRGSEGSIVTDGVRQVVVTVIEGAFTFTFAGETIVIPAGRGAFGADNKVTQGTAQQIFNQLPPNFQQQIGTLQNMTNAINQAAQQGNNNNNNNPPPPPPPPPEPPPQPGPSNPPGNTGGGTGSSR